MYFSHLFVVRSTLSSIAFSGASLGTVLSMLSRWRTFFLALLDLYKILRLLNWGNIEDNQHHHFSGLIIQLVSWKWVFYLQGGLALLWCLLWVLLVADSPDKHRWQRLKNNLRLKSKVRFWLFEFSDMKEQPQKFAIKSIVVAWGILMSSISSGSYQVKRQNTLLLLNQNRFKTK